MNWSKGFSSRYYVTFVDPVTWQDLETFNITGGSINVSEDNLRQTADLDCVRYEEQGERWVRVWLDARQNDDSYHGALFTGLASSPSKSISGNYISNTLQCYSVLKPLDDVLLPRGWFASPGNTENLIRTLLAVTPAPVVIDDTEPLPALSSTIIAEDGETYLSMLEVVLNAVNWRLQITGEGAVYISPIASAYSASFDAIDNDCLETEITVTNDWYSCPNVFRVIVGEMSAVARDESEDSMLSIPNRGREIWAEESNGNIYAGESLSAYASRRLSEEQMHDYEISYTRRYHPDVNVSDLVRIHYPGQEIDGIFYVASQTINLGYGASVSEVADRI